MELIGSADDIRRCSFLTAVLAEFIGTGLLVVFACGTCLHASDDAGTITVSFAFGFSVATLVSRSIFFFTWKLRIFIKFTCHRWFLTYIVVHFPYNFINWTIHLNMVSVMFYIMWKYGNCFRVNILTISIESMIMDTLSHIDTQYDTSLIFTGHSEANASEFTFIIVCSNLQSH